MFRRKRAISFLLVLALLIGTLLLPGVSAVAEDSIDKLSEDILALEAVTVDSYDAVYSMVDRYNALGNTGLSSDAVNRLNKLKDRVDYLKENGLYYYDDFDSFQPQDKTYGWWECINSDTVVEDFKSVVSKQKLATEDFQSYIKNGKNTEGIVNKGYKGNCLAISALPSTSDLTLNDHKNGTAIPKQVFALPNTVTNGKGITKASFKYYWMAYTDYSLILSMQDNLHYSGIKLAGKDTGIKKIDCNIDSAKFCTEEVLVKSSELNGYYYATWVDVTLEYITKEDGNYYRITFLSPKTINKAENTEKLTDTVDIKVDAPISNLYLTGDNIVSSYKYSKLSIDHIGIDDVMIYTSDETDYLVNQISLLPDTDNLTIDNYYLCMSLYQHYLKLSDTDKKRVTNIDKLRAAKQKVEILWKNIPDELLSGKPITFEDKKDIRYISGNANVTNDNWGIIDNPKSDSINSSDSVLHIVPSIQEDNVGVYLLNDDLVSGSKPLKYFNFKMYLEPFVNIYDCRPLIVYDYQDENNWRAINISLTWGGRIIVRPYDKVDGNPVREYKYGRQDGIYANEAALILNDTTKDFNMTDGGWINVSLSYTGVECKLTVYTEDGFAKPGTVTYNLINGNSTRVGFASAKFKFGMSVDDISVVNNTTANVIDADNYLSKHSQILSLRAATVSNVEYEALQAAITDYSALEGSVKYALPLVGEKLKLLTERMAEIKDDPNYDLTGLLRADDDYNTYTDNFDTEASLGRYQDIEMSFTYNTRSPSTLGRPPVVVYDDITNSNVLQLEGSMIEIKDCFLPDKAKIKTLKFDTWIDSSSTKYPAQWQPLQFYISYIDQENFTLLRFYGYNNAQPDSIDVINVRNGVAGDAYRNKGMKPSFDPYKPISVEISCVDDSGKYFLKMSQGDVKLEEFIRVGSIQGRFAMGSVTTGILQMYDNVSITMEKGDWDEDIVPEEATVYYTGNTYVGPGEVAIVNGDSIGDFVTAVEIAQLPNDTAGGFGYINRTSFDFAEVKEGTYSLNPVVPSWSELSHVSVPILQKTEQSVKFLIPDTFTDGIYAVKIYGKNTASSDDDKILYINIPVIDYTIGNEGAIAEAGEELSIVGKNLAANLTAFSNSDLKLNSVRVKLVGADGQQIELTPLSADSDNMIKVQLPQNLNGKYEVYIYNGYGDETAWSVPSFIDVGKGPRTSWNESVYNIRDFGATGDSSQNVTPIVTSAFDYMNENGGGTLYFPKGVYRFEYSVVLPEKITISGEDTQSTIFLFSPYKWDYNSMPQFLLGITGNVEIKNLSIYATRSSGVFRINGDSAENIYISNVRVELRPYAGKITEGGESCSLLVKAIEAQNMIQSESVAPLLYKAGGYITNLQMNNVDFITYGRHRGIVCEDSSQSAYWQFYNVHVAMGTLGNYQQSIMNNSIFIDCNFENAATGFWGHGVYFGHTTMQNVVVNNREVYVADHGPYIGNCFLQQIDDNTFLINSKCAPGRFTGCQIYISSGQGVGQTRIITKVENLSDNTTKFTVNSPFAIPPNRNSSCIIRAPRENIFFANCYFYNGACCGFYGGVADAVYESCTYDRTGMLYQWAFGGDVNWYISYNDNEIIYDPYLYTSGTSLGSSTLTINASGGSGYSRCFIIRGFDFNGESISISTSASKNALTDLIIDNSIFSNTEKGIVWDNSKGSAAIEGAFIYRNVFDEVDKPYSDSVLSMKRFKNLYFSEKLIIYDDKSYEQNLILGDVNGDGQINLKDCTYIRYYSINRIDFDDNQLKRADVNADGVVDLKDATMIRYFTVGKISGF